MKKLLLFPGLGLALCLTAQTWNCISISGGTPTIAPSNSIVCNAGYAPAYFTQTATYSVAAWNSHLGANVFGPKPVAVNGSGACNEPTGSFVRTFPVSGQPLPHRVAPARGM